MVHHPELLRHAPWQTVEHIGQSDAADRLETAGQTGEQVRFAQDRPVTGEALSGARQAVAIDIKQSEIIEQRRVGAVDEEAGADASLEVPRRKVGPVKVEQALGGATPGEAIGNAVDQAVVNPKHQRRVDGVSSRDRRGIRRLQAWSIVTMLGHHLAMAASKA